MSLGNSHESVTAGPPPSSLLEKEKVLAARVGDLEFPQFRRRLAEAGVGIRIGPFLVRLRCRWEHAASAVHRLYADFPLDDDPLVDFHVHLRPPSPLRRWLRPRVVFSCDDFVPFAACLPSLAPAVFEWGMNWCIAEYAHQFLMIHAAVLERDSRALVLCGQSGAGKSTLCAALALAGWRLLSDEMALVRPADGRIIPMARPILLKNQSLAVLRGRHPEIAWGAVARDSFEGEVALLRPPATSVARVDEPALPGWVVFVRYRAGLPIRSRPVAKGVSLLRLAEHSFNYDLLGLAGFETLGGLVDRSDCYRLRYSELDEALAWLAGLPVPQASGACRC